MPTARRHSRGNQTLVAAAIAALLVHGTVLSSVEAFGLSFGGSAGFAAKGPAVADDDQPELKTSCSGDVLLATSARAAMCLAPWRGGDVSECENDAQMSLWMDLSSCQAHDDAIAASPISLVPARQAEKLKPIDPEPLLEEYKKQLEEEKKIEVPKPQPQVAQQQPPPPPPAPARPQQVVETAKPDSEKAPENARFLSEHDITVEKQKVARGSVNEPMVAKSKEEELTAKNNPKEASMKELPKDDPGKETKAPPIPGKLAMRAPGAEAPSDAPQEQKTKGSQSSEKGPLVADGFVPRRGDGAIEQEKRDRGEQQRGQSGAGGGSPQTPNLKPTDEALERALGGGSVDHLDDVENGDETALSSKRWIYASFFNRMKRQVAQNWDPATVWRRADPNGTTYGSKTRVTEVRVSLNASGALTKIVVTTPSGVSDLDEEAVRSFHAAAPFVNPPEGLVKDGSITFAFSFFFEIGAPRSSWRVVRSM
jgi:protein TonB